MTALGDVGTEIEIAPNAGVKIIQVTFPATVIGGTDTATVDLSDFGCTNIHGILVFDETTAGSVVVTQAPTSTSVTSSTLTITFGGSATCKKTAILFAY
jgi:hypothetical protein